MFASCLTVCPEHISLPPPSPCKVGAPSVHTGSTRWFASTVGAAPPRCVRRPIAVCSHVAIVCRVAAPAAGNEGVYDQDFPDTDKDGGLAPGGEQGADTVTGEEGFYDQDFLDTDKAAGLAPSGEQGADADQYQVMSHDSAADEHASSAEHASSNDFGNDLGAPPGADGAYNLESAGVSSEGMYDHDAVNNYSSSYAPVDTEGQGIAVTLISSGDYDL